MRDVLSTRIDWINQVRDPSTMDDHWYADGDEKFITIECIPIKDPAHKAGIQGLLSGLFRTFRPIGWSPAI
jgi:hypothetical protein